MRVGVAAFAVALFAAIPAAVAADRGLPRVKGLPASFARLPAYQAAAICNLHFTVLTMRRIDTVQRMAPFDEEVKRTGDLGRLYFVYGRDVLAEDRKITRYSAAMILYREGRKWEGPNAGAARFEPACIKLAPAVQAELTKMGS